MSESERKQSYYQSNKTLKPLLALRIQLYLRPDLLIFSGEIKHTAVDLIGLFSFFKKNN